jgi:hypothetical protein
MSRYRSDRSGPSWDSDKGRVGRQRVNREREERKKRRGPLVERKASAVVAMEQAHRVFLPFELSRPVKEDASVLKGEGGQEEEGEEEELTQGQ